MHHSYKENKCSGGAIEFHGNELHKSWLGVLSEGNVIVQWNICRHVLVEMSVSSISAATWLDTDGELGGTEDIVGDGCLSTISIFKGSNKS